MVVASHGFNDLVAGSAKSIGIILSNPLLVSSISQCDELATVWVVCVLEVTQYPLLEEVEAWCLRLEQLPATIILVPAGDACWHVVEHRVGVELTRIDALDRAACVVSISNLGLPDLSISKQPIRLAYYT